MFYKPDTAVSWQHGGDCGRRRTGSEVEVRRIVVQSLWRIGDRRAIAPLNPLLDDPGWLVRYFAARALIQPFPY
jgi:HEAT repeat protein